MIFSRRVHAVAMPLPGKFVTVFDTSLDALEYAIIVLCPVGYVWALEPAAAATVESIRGSFAQPTPQGVPLNGDAIAASEAERGKHARYCFTCCGESIGWEVTRNESARFDFVNFSFLRGVSPQAPVWLRDCSWIKVPGITFRAMVFARTKVCGRVEPGDRAGPNVAAPL